SRSRLFRRQACAGGGTPPDRSRVDAVSDHPVGPGREGGTCLIATAGRRRPDPPNGAADQGGTRLCPGTGRFVQLLRTCSAVLGNLHGAGLYIRQIGAGSARRPIAEIVHTVGHSTRTLDQLVELLALNGVQLLVDVRSAPGSRRMPYFARASLEVALPENAIAYLH